MFEIKKSSDEMVETLNAFSNDLKNIRTGRVSDILKSIVVDSMDQRCLCLNYLTSIILII